MSASKDLGTRLTAKSAMGRNGCYVWTGSTGDRGHGQIWSGGRRGEGRLIQAHRAAYEQWVGPIPNGLIIRHRCDNPPCINPAHLEPGTYADNSRDAVERGRVARAFRLPHTRMSDDDVRSVRERYVKQFEKVDLRHYRSNATELAAEYGVRREYILAVVERHERAGVV